MQIGKTAFKGCTGLTSIVIPKSVMEIGTSFQVIPDRLAGSIYDSHYLPWSTFMGCTELKSITVSDGNKKYDSRDNCNAIIETATNKLIKGCASTIIPDSVTEIERYAFNGCTGLTSITIPDSVTEIGDGAFRDCTGLTSIVMGNSVTIIGGQAFDDCTGLTSINIPDSVTKIKNGAFEGCTGLTSMVLGNSVEEIGDSAFRDCSGLTIIDIPESVTKIGDSAFRGCTHLEAIYCHVEDPNQIEIERGVELGGEQATLYVPAGKGVVAAYKKKAVWKKFDAIKPMEEK